tara:strand:- start:298 stop:789 length:492 start_codon:yes stop_codon:yes gene_type:complete
MTRTKIGVRRGRLQKPQRLFFSLRCSTSSARTDFPPSKDLLYNPSYPRIIRKTKKSIYSGESLLDFFSKFFGKTASDNYSSQRTRLFFPEKIAYRIFRLLPSRPYKRTGIENGHISILDRAGKDKSFCAKTAQNILGVNQVPRAPKMYESDANIASLYCGCFC